jgi:hypothetical protein
LPKRKRIARFKSRERKFLGRITKWRIEPGRTPQHRALMRERLEARAPMVRAHPAFAQSAERQSRANHVRHDIVHARAAGPRVRQHAGFRGAVASEHIQRQRGRLSAQQGERVVEFVKFQHRQDRPENLLLHHRRVRGHPGQNRWRDEQIFASCRPP